MTASFTGFPGVAAVMLDALSGNAGKVAQVNSGEDGFDPVTSFGTGEMPSLSNMDDNTAKTNVYLTGSGVSGTLPDSQEDCIVLHFRHTDNQVLQIASPLTYGGTLFYREYNSSSWSSWTEVGTGSGTNALTIVEETGNFTMDAADFTGDKYIQCNSASALTATLDTGISVDGIVYLEKTGTGDVTVSGTATINGDTEITEQYDVLALFPTGTDEYTGVLIAGGGSGGGDVAVEEEGSQVLAAASTFNFTGAGVSVSDAGGGQVDVDVKTGGIPCESDYLTLKEGFVTSYEDGDDVPETDFDTSKVTTFVAKDVVFPSTVAEGTLFELGGATEGCWVGIHTISSTDYFFLEFGDTTSNKDASDTSTVVLKFTNFPKDDAAHEVVWEFHPNSPDGARIRCWIDGELKGTETTTDNSNASVWSGTDDGGYATVGTMGGSNPTGVPTGDWPDTVGTMYQYRDLEVFTANLSPASPIAFDNETTTSYTLTENDLAGGVYKEMDNASNITVTVNSGMSNAQPVTFEQAGAGAVIFSAGAGVTINSFDGTHDRTAGQYATVTLIPKGGDVYILSGNTAAP